MSFPVSEADRRIANIIAIGTVAEIDAARARAKVHLEQGLFTPMIPVNALRAGPLQIWWMPSIGEQVVIASPSGEIANAVIIASLFASNQSSADPTTPKIDLRGGNIEINGNIVLTGNISLTGRVTAEQDVTAQGVSLVTHIHTGVAAGPSTTGGPVK